MPKKILKMIWKRLVQSVITIFLVTVILFLLMQLVEGNPIVNYLGCSATEEQIAYYTHLYGYDQPVLVQYWNWVTGLFKGTMGFSISYQKEISEIIFSRLSATLNLVTLAFIVAVLFGVSFGIISALNRGKMIDTVISVIANIGISMPIFWVGIILILVFSIKLNVLPAYGFVPMSEGLLPWLRTMIMPVVVCSFSALAQFTRQTRSSMLEVINQDYVLTAKAKGVGRGAIIVKHQLRNALIPLITILVNRFATMIGTTVLIESIFVIPGLGSLMISSITSRDFLVVENCVLIIAIFVTAANLLIDILYGFIDPRIRDV